MNRVYPERNLDSLRRQIEKLNRRAARLMDPGETLAQAWELPSSVFHGRCLRRTGNSQMLALGAMGASTTTRPCPGISASGRRPAGDRQPGYFPN